MKGRRKRSKGSSENPEEPLSNAPDSEDSDIVEDEEATASASDDDDTPDVGDDSDHDSDDDDEVDVKAAKPEPAAQAKPAAKSPSVAGERTKLGGSGIDDGPRHGEEFISPSAALIVMLIIFLAIGILALVSIMGGTSNHGDFQTGTVAHRPSDFPEVPFNAPFPEAGATTNKEGAYLVPPPPFSDADLFPCAENCHNDQDTNPERRVLEDNHETIVLNHGPKERWCFDCHNPDNRDMLRLAGGALVPFSESYRLCGQCHGTIYRDWRAGIHGRRRGFWNGQKSYLLCPTCHNPHAPKFQPIKPLPPPIRPNLLAASKGSVH